LINGINGIMEAGPGEITFLANPKYQDKLPLCKATAVVVSPEVQAEGVNLIRTENPRLAFAKLVNHLLVVKKESGKVSPKAFIEKGVVIGKNTTVYPGVSIGKDTRIGKNCLIYPGVFIGENVQIGDDCLIDSNVSIHYDSVIGDRVILNSNCVIGSQGFGFEREGEAHYKIPQIGSVLIEDDVEIGALCAIDRGSIKTTRIGKGTKLDNLVHVAHNCQIGENNLLLTQTGLAGTVKTGKSVYFAGRAGCLDHLSVADYAQIGSNSVVTSNILEPGKYYGYPARPYKDWSRASAMFYQTDDLRQKVIDLENKISVLENK
ncbi:MAG: UDP-3-O-(3-hydroxymyristoyl)glucosamine N-acyltransferase, partial [Deltaproteobacteria bacterium]|nr:UDP-3-O-(3-hydroxymyristoyl)glucosamine N-acyltransferase [Deltaproteobacteria bacterium]